MVFHISVHVGNKAQSPGTYYLDCTAHTHHGKSYPRVHYPQHPKLRGTIFLWMAIGKSTMPSTPLKRVLCRKTTLQKKKKPWRWNFSGCTFLRIQLLWSEIASNSIKTIYVTNSCPHTVWGPALGQKKEKLWIRERTSGAANNQTAVLSYSDREYKRLLAQKVYQRSPFQLSNSRKYQEPLLSWWPL